jgi:rod shape-determining protein MreB
MDEAIADPVKRKHSLLIGERMAEKIKIEIGSASRLEEPRTIDAKGRNLVKNVPMCVVLDDGEIRAAINESVSAIVTAIRTALELIPPELAGDISERGIILASGGALLRQMDQRIRAESGLSVSIADDHSCCVALGAGKVLEDFQFLRRGRSLSEEKEIASEAVQHRVLAGDIFLRSGTQGQTTAALYV